MTRFDSQVEKSVLETLVPELEAEGYEVLIHPRASSLPKFMQGYIPDAIALSESRNIAIEVTGGKRQGSEKVTRLQQLFEKETNWEFRVIYYKPENDAQALPKISNEAIEKAIGEIKELMDKGLLQASLLIGWSTFEAVSRNLLPKIFERPQTPGRLIENLANRGQITPDDADTLRSLVVSRNRVIHGGLDTVPTVNELNSFIHILDHLKKRHPSDK
tara:strand:+ start:603 stop:1253 length:651 start_codon:yes stop_codon:yes gene_type:complete